MSSENEETIKDIANTEQEEFRLKGADDYPYTFDDLCFDHQKVAKTILAMKDFNKDPKQWESEVKRQFKLDGETVLNKDDNILVKKIEECGTYCSVQGHVTETDKEGKIIKYPVVSFNADIRQYEKVYRALLQDMKDFFVNNPEALK
jgi:hypothetical protein